MVIKICCLFVLQLCLWSVRDVTAGFAYHHGGYPYQFQYQQPAYSFAPAQQLAYRSPAYHYQPFQRTPPAYVPYQQVAAPVPQYVHNPYITQPITVKRYYSDSKSEEELGYFKGITYTNSHNGGASSNVLFITGDGAKAFSRTLGFQPVYRFTPSQLGETSPGEIMVMMPDSAVIESDSEVVSAEESAGNVQLQREAPLSTRAANHHEENLIISPARELSTTSRMPFTHMPTTTISPPPTTERTTTTERPTTSSPSTTSTIATTTSSATSSTNAMDMVDDETSTNSSKMMDTEDFEGELLA